MNPPARRPSLQQLLVEVHGCEPAEGFRLIRDEIFSRRWRAADRVQRLLTGQAHSAEWELVRDLGYCDSSAAINEAFLDYRNNLTRMSPVSRLLLGGPRQGKALQFFRRLKEQARAGS